MNSVIKTSSVCKRCLLSFSQTYSNSSSFANILKRSGLYFSSSGSDGSIKANKSPLRKPNTPKGKFDKDVEEKNQGNDSNEKSDDPYAPFPDNINPVSGEVGGPRGPEPTRYGDWERKGRVSDF